MDLNNTGYNGNRNLKRIGLPIEYAPDQIEEYVKCMNDPVYFIRTYCKVVSLDRGFVNFDLYDYQERFITAIHNNRKVAGMFSRQQGKCFEKGTTYTVRNKITGETQIVTAEEFHKKCS